MVILQINNKNRVYSLYKRLIFMGPLTGEVNGQNLVTQKILEQFEDLGVDLRVVDTSSSPKFLSYFAKLCCHFKACAVVLSFPGDIYLSLNSNKGLWLSLIVATVGKFRGKKVGVHHHSFAHVRQKSLAMSLLVKVISGKGFHIVLGGAMSRGLKKLYPDATNIFVLNNAIVVPCEYTQISQADNSVLRIGHLSNLSIEKGCAEVVKASIAAKLAGYNVRLNLAGPVGDSKTMDQINKARHVLKGDLTVWGPVYGQDKKSFFEAIDIFHFPSAYKNEAEPLVVLESLASGVAVAATDIGCIAEDIGNGAGVIVRNDAKGLEDFVDFLALYQKDKALYKTRSRARFFELLEDSHQQFLSVNNFYFFPEKNISH